MLDFSQTKVFRMKHFAPLQMEDTKKQTHNINDETRKLASYV